MRSIAMLLSLAAVFLAPSGAFAKNRPLVPATMAAHPVSPGGHLRSLRLHHNTDPVVYVSDYTGNTILEFDQYTGALISTASSGLLSPRGLTTDDGGDVYVANASLSSVLEYGPSLSGPIAVFNDPRYYVQDVAVGGKAVKGTIFATAGWGGSDGFGEGHVAEFVPPSTSPTATLQCAPMWFYYFIAVGPTGDVFVDGLQADEKTTVLAEFPHGSTTCTILHPKFRLLFPGGLAVLADDSLVVADPGANIIRTYPAPYTIPTHGFTTGAGPEGIAVNPGDGSLWVAQYGVSNVQEDFIPSGLVEETFPIGVGFGPFGVAVYPPQR